jgi:hypothetical protein
MGQNPTEDELLALVMEVREYKHTLLYYLVTGYTHGVSSLSFSIASSLTSLLPH